MGKVRMHIMLRQAVHRHHSMATFPNTEIGVKVLCAKNIVL
jgi:hypothetical protein